MSQENPVKGDTKPEKENNSQSKNEIANNSAPNVSKVAQQVDEEQKSSHNSQKTPDAIMSQPTEGAQTGKQAKKDEPDGKAPLMKGVSNPPLTKLPPSGASNLPEGQLIPNLQPPEDAGERPVYCVCRRSDETTMMIACDICEEWYHIECIGLRAVSTLLAKPQYSSFFIQYLVYTIVFPSLNFILRSGFIQINNGEFYQQSEEFAFANKNINN